MHKVSAKRQVTIPKELCEKAGIEPGNLVEIFEYEGKVTVIKKELDASAGILKSLKGNAAITDEESLQDALVNKHKARKKGRTV
jgi:AbrB family looped-hinge helix DNA binding protein